jgi:hypothetical protein
MTATHQLADAGFHAGELAVQRRACVRVEGRDLWWPDYPGNNLFNSLGNLAVNPEAALLFFDFATGRTLHLSGTAEVEWGMPGRTGTDGATGRIVRFTPHHIVAGRFGPIERTLL